MDEVISVLPATEDDWCRIHECLIYLADVGNIDKEKVSLIWNERLKKEIHTIVAVISGPAIVGTASYWVEPKFIHEGGRVLHVEDVAVRGDYQNKGVGRALMDYIKDSAVIHSCYKIILNCKPDKYTFYKKLGFEQVGIEMRFNNE